MSQLKQFLCIALLAFTTACAGQSITPSSHTGCKKSAECCKESCVYCDECNQENCDCPHCAARHSTNKVTHELLYKKMGKYPSCEQHKQ